MAGQGFNTRCGLGKETTYGTPVAVDTLVPFKSEDIPRVVATIRDEWLDGVPAPRGANNSVVSVQGTVNLEAVYDVIAGDLYGIDDWLLGALGAVTYISSNSGNQFTVSDTLDVFFTLAFEKNVSIWEVAGLKVNTLEITASAGGKLEISVGVIGQNLRRTGDSGITNTSTTVGGDLAPTARPGPIQFDEVIFRIDNQTGALGAGDQVNVSEWTLTVNNNLTEPEHATPESGENSLQTLEPIRNGKREVILTATFPRYESDTIAKYLDTAQMQQIDIKATDGTSQFNIYLPNVALDEPAAAPISGAEKFPLTLTWRAYYNDDGSGSAINGSMLFLDAATEILGEVAFETVNARTAIP